MTDDPVRKAAQDLIHLWQTEAKTALIALDVWPELGEAIDRLGEALAPARAHIRPGMTLRIAELEPGDTIRFDLPASDLSAEFYNAEPWTVTDCRPDNSRPGRGYWRIAGHRPGGDQFATDEHSSFEVIWLGEHP